MSAGRASSGLAFLAPVYGWAAARRRARYRRRPSLARRLSRPVISVGNLSVGGSGKTPVVLAVAELLRARGERPAILSRGYARRTPSPGTVVVSDGEAVRVGVEASGDEPQLLARRLPGVPVVVDADRFAAGRVAEGLGCTVHLLDDGFQHLALARDVDLLLISTRDVADRVLPAGRLREPAGAAWQASAWLTFEPSADPLLHGLAACAEPGADAAAPPLFALRARLGAARALAPWGAADPAPPARAVAVAGIANPERFFADARSAGWTLASELTFRDHHWFSDGDWRDIVAAAGAAKAGTILMTEKDAVRLSGRAGQPPDGIALRYLPQQVVLPEGFADWLVARLEAAR